MANPEHEAILHQGAEVWNFWRKIHQEIRPDLRGTFLPAGTDLMGIDLHKADLRHATLQGITLSRANLYDADLSYANLSAFIADPMNPDREYYYKTDMEGANLRGANMAHADCTSTNFKGACLAYAFAIHADFHAASLQGADCQSMGFKHAYVGGTDLSGANCENANFQHSEFSPSSCQGTNVAGASFQNATFGFFGRERLTQAVGLETATFSINDGTQVGLSKQIPGGEKGIGDKGNPFSSNYVDEKMAELGLKIPGDMSPQEEVKTQTSKGVKLPGQRISKGWERQ